MKRVLIVVVLAMVLIMTACGNSKAPETPTDFSNIPASEPASQPPVDNVFPSHYTELVNPFSPGGFNDMTARVIASVATDYMEYPMVVVTKPGGGGTIGADYVRQGGLDSYRMIWGLTSQAVFGPLTVPDYPYEFEDWDYICSLCSTDRLIVVRKDTWSSLEELFEYTKKNPGKVSFGSSGSGTIGHLSAEMVANEGGVQWTHIPYDGSSAALAALLGGHIDLMSGQPSEIMELYTAGEIVPLVITTKMEDIFPGVPTMEDMGYGKWNARVVYPVGVPAGTSKDNMAMLEEVFQKVSEDASFIKLMDNIGVEVEYMNGADTKAAFVEFYTDMKDIVEKIGLSVK